jgi:hypothetical protein
MTEKRDANIASGLEGIVPGKDLEKAAAEVATDAGKGLVQGVKRVLGAATGEWIVKKEAKAEAARKAIETQAEIDRANALTEARRASDLSEIDHHGSLEIAKRRAERMLLEMAHQQQTSR